MTPTRTYTRGLKSACLILLLPLLPAYAQRAPAKRQAMTPQQRYARAILLKADSAALTLPWVLHEIARVSAATDSSDLKLELLMATLARASSDGGDRAHRLAGDFDAVVPPAEYARLHEQMSTALQDLAAGLNRVGQSATLACGEEFKGPDHRCVLKDGNALMISALALKVLMAKVDAYAEVRQRSQRMLRESAVNLPPFQLSNTSPKT